MSETPENRFPRALFGYRKQEVDDCLARKNQEKEISEQTYEERIRLLTVECYRAQKAQTEEEEKNRVLRADMTGYQHQLKDSGETVNTLYRRLDTLGAEVERLKSRLKQAKSAKQTDGNRAETADWKQRALTAEETVRRLAQAEINRQPEQEPDRKGARHLRLPLGKAAYLDMTLRKETKNI